MAKEQPKPGWVVKRLFECHLDEINQMERRHRTVQNGYNEVRISGFFGDDFLKKNLHFRVQWHVFGEITNWLTVKLGRKKMKNAKESKR